ncbi:hypothetical protein CP02DC24_0397 [Chlamydia psittaci 02DC24]|nr:hypothetical protein CP02DC24_0397 [Chlamydia psittaci 02DC24]
MTTFKIGRYLSCTKAQESLQYTPGVYRFRLGNEVLIACGGRWLAS